MNLSRNGVPDGLGIIYNRNGAKIEGHFANGELVNQVYEASKCKELLGIASHEDESTRPYIPDDGMGK